MDLAESIEETERRLDLESALSRLPERTQLIIRLKYGMDGKQPMSNHDLAEYFLISERTVRKIHLQAIRTLRQNIQ